jgi:hypothetical protein
MAVSLQVSTAQRDTPSRICPRLSLSLFPFQQKDLRPNDSDVACRRSVAYQRIKSDARLSSHEECSQNTMATLLTLGVDLNYRALS